MIKTRARIKPSTDLKELCDIAIQNGASRAKVISTELIVIDERTQLKCRYPPCPNYGKNLMCPPYTPSAKEFRGYVAKYKQAIIVQYDFWIEEIRGRIKDGTKLTELVKNEEIRSLTGKGMERLHAIISAVERESFNKGYYFSLGLTAGPCRLCDTCEPSLPCAKPWEARPSMEAVGIDVYKTAENSGLDIKWNTKGFIILNGLILVD